jgi:hypothetical protein
MKPSELQDAALDWAVAKCEGELERADYYVHESNGAFMLERGEASWVYSPTINWALGGPIIEEEKIGILFYVDHIPDADEPIWVASCGGERALGDTPLIAAMRCYVLLELGKDVDIPEELK